MSSLAAPRNVPNEYAAGIQRIRASGLLPPGDIAFMSILTLIRNSGTYSKRRCEP